MFDGLSCRKFQKLTDDRDIRDLTSDEELFMDGHSLLCAECSELQRTSGLAMNMLRMSAMEPEISSGFDERVLRKVRLQTVRSGFNYWSPAVIGAAIAGIAVLAAMQAVTLSSEGPMQRKANHEESRLMRGRDFPSLDLDLPRSQP